ncbi:MAG: ATP-dependent DNA helicase [Saprospiraceae bacterium]
MQLTADQQKAMQALQQFFRAPEERVFILNGQAGTGKTTLVQELVKWLQANKFYPVLLATTGRAAKVLKEKSNVPAVTLHSHIYTFDDIRGEDASGEDAWESSTGQLILDFGIRENTFKTPEHVFIVDESSMISHEINEEANIAKFGSGSLLDDFMEFTRPNKVVFVGDGCQLPPVAKTPFSGALDADFLADRYEVLCRGAELREIMRQHAANEILQMAAFFRKGIERGQFEKYPRLKVSGTSSRYTVVHEQEELLLEAFVEQIKSQDAVSQVMLTNSNWKCQELNRKVRRALGHTAKLQVGDLLMVIQNSYITPLVNGDQVIVESVTEDVFRAGMQFLNVELRQVHNGEISKTKLIADLLLNDSNALAPNAFKALMLDFDTRMRNLGVKRKSAPYREAMMSDPYLNALRAKYGYALTCHKAQGGEWPEVFLYVHKSVFGLRDAALYRWFYTAITRAKNRLHLHRAWWVEKY